MDYGSTRTLLQARLDKVLILHQCYFTARPYVSATLVVVKVGGFTDLAT